MDDTSLTLLDGLATAGLSVLIRPRYFFWEGVDMVRKLVLVGVLVLVGRGSVFQLFVAAIVSCISLVLQVHLAPCECDHHRAFAMWDLSSSSH